MTLYVCIYTAAKTEVIIAQAIFFALIPVFKYSPSPLGLQFYQAKFFGIAHTKSTDKFFKYISFLSWENYM